jgi:pyruvate dehydrogenase (quinone)
MQMLGMGSLITIAKYWRQWRDPRLVIAVLNNRDLNQVTWELRAMGGFPKIEETQDVPGLNYAAYAELLGLRGLRVERPEQVGPAWDEALRSDRPCVIDAVVDPDVAALPPHISYEQASNFLKSILKGDADAGSILWQSLKRSWT